MKKLLYSSENYFHYIKATLFRFWVIGSIFNFLLLYIIIFIFNSNYEISTKLIAITVVCLNLILLFICFIQCKRYIRNLELDVVWDSNVEGLLLASTMFSIPLFIAMLSLIK